MRRQARSQAALHHLGRRVALEARVGDDPDRRRRLDRHQRPHLGARVERDVVVVEVASPWKVTVPSVQSCAQHREALLEDRCRAGRSRGRAPRTRAARPPRGCPCRCRGSCGRPRSGRASPTRARGRAGCASRRPCRPCRASRARCAARSPRAARSARSAASRRGCRRPRPSRSPSSSTTLGQVEQHRRGRSPGAISGSRLLRLTPNSSGRRAQLASASTDHLLVGRRLEAELRHADVLGQRGARPARRRRRWRRAGSPGARRSSAAGCRAARASACGSGPSGRRSWRYISASIALPDASTKRAWKAVFAWKKPSTSPASAQRGHLVDQRLQRARGRPASRRGTARRTASVSSASRTW